MAGYIDIKDLTVTYETKTGPINALQSIDLSVADNEFVSILGPSGCGKSTLLKTIGNILEPTTGTIQLSGEPVSQARKRRHIGFVFQKPVLLPWRTVLDNVAFPLEIIGSHDRKKRIEECERVLDLVGIADFKNNFPHELSGGMQQRVALARALSFSPLLLLMDEPFGSLDEINREKMNFELLRIWNKVRHTILFVTHSIEEAVFLSDRIVILSKRPGVVLDVISIPFERPRQWSIRYSDAFINITKKAHILLANQYEE